MNPQFMKPLLHTDMFEDCFQFVLEHDGLPSHLVLAQIDTNQKCVTKSKMINGQKYYLNNGYHIYEIANYQTKNPGFDIFIDKEWIIKFTTQNRCLVLNVLKIPPHDLQILKPASAARYGILYSAPNTRHVTHWDCTTKFDSINLQKSKD